MVTQVYVYAVEHGPLIMNIVGDCHVHSSSGREFHPTMHGVPAVPMCDDTLHCLHTYVHTYDAFQDDHYKHGRE